MEIRQLRYFVEICKYRNFTRAADACYISTQGISMAILRLENELNRQLFVRDKQGVTLTPAAEFLLPRAKKMLALNSECEAYFATGATHQSVLPVAFAPGSIEEFAGELLGVFEQEHPEIQVEVREYCDTDCEKAVSSGEVEVGFTCGPVAPNQFESRLLAVSPHALIVHRDHPLAARKFIRAEDVRGLPLVMLRDTTKTYSVIRAGCQMAGFEPVVETFVDNILTVYDLAQIKKAVGVSTMVLMSHLDRPELRAIPFEDPIFQWSVHFIRRRGAALSPAAKLFQQAVLKKLEKQGILHLPKEREAHP